MYEVLSETRVNSRGNNEQDYLEMKAKHADGRYYVTVTKIMETQEDGCTMKKFMPFNNGNFQFTLMHGRKSQKKLDKLNELINSKASELVELWKNNDYSNMVQEVTFASKAQKLI